MFVVQCFNSKESFFKPNFGLEFRFLKLVKIVKIWLGNFRKAKFTKVENKDSQILNGLFKFGPLYAAF